MLNALNQNVSQAAALAMEGLQMNHCQFYLFIYLLLQIFTTMGTKAKRNILLWFSKLGMLDQTYSKSFLQK